MACYLGCGTRCNRARWIAFFILALFGLALVATAIGVAARDYNDYTDCLKELKDDGIISESQYDDFKDDPGFDSDFDSLGNPEADRCQKRYLEDNANAWGVLFWIGIALLAISLIPCCLMCCCGRAPEEYVTAQAVAVPYMHQNDNQPFAGQPGYVQPYQSQTPAGARVSVDTTPAGYPKV